MKEKILTLIRKIKDTIAPYQKTIVNPLLGIIGIIVVCTLITRFLGGSETLSEYAEKNPEIAYAQPTSGIDQSTDDISSEDLTSNEPSIINTISNNDSTITVADGFIASPYNESDSFSELSILYWDFNNDVQNGVLICDSSIATKLLNIFYSLYLSRYQIERVVSMEEYNNDYLAAVADNNTFCYYEMPESNAHSAGLTIEVNPLYNPEVRTDVSTQEVVALPETSKNYANRENIFPYKIDSSDLCYRYFTEAGFAWGGNYNANKIYSQFTYISR